MQHNPVFLSSVVAYYCEGFCKSEFTVVANREPRVEFISTLFSM